HRAHRHSPLFPYTTLFRSLDHGVDALPLALRGHSASIGKEIQQAAWRHVGIERAVFRQIAQAGRASQAIERHVVAGNASLAARRSEEHTSELQSLTNLVCR